MAETVAKFGGIDILVNNASAISLTGTLATPMKRYDLMHQINARGTFMVSQKCIPHLQKAANPHVLNLSPPLDFDVKWFANHAAYTLAKYGMSVFAWAMAAEFAGQGHRLQLPVAAHGHRHGGDPEHAGRRRRHEAAAASPRSWPTPPTRSSTARRATCTGNFFIDDEVLAAEGVTDFDQYAVSPGTPLMPDFFVPAPGARTVVGKARAVATFLLVHGACTGGWCWEKVVPLLEAAGHKACAPDLPGLGKDDTPPANVTLADNVDKLARLLDKMEEQVILVGHSLGGVTIGQLAEARRRKMKALVYLCALLPTSGKSGKRHDSARARRHVPAVTPGQSRRQDLHLRARQAAEPVLRRRLAGGPLQGDGASAAAAARRSRPRR